MATILIEGIKLHAFHGVLHEERKIGGQYRIDIEIEADLIYAAEDDDLLKTIDYTSVYDIVKEEMQLSSQLIENVAYRIIKKINNTFKQALYIKVKITKINPPVHGHIENVAVVLESTRET